MGRRDRGRSNRKKVVATIPVGGVLEFPASDGAGKVFVNVQDKGELAAIDVKTMKTVAVWPMKDCKSPTGLVYVPGPKLLVSSCGQSGIAKVLRADTGAEVASLSIAMGADAVMYDAKRNVVLIPCRAGELEVISMADPEHISVVQRVPTQEGSRTGTSIPTRDASTPWRRSSDHRQRRADAASLPGRSKYWSSRRKGAEKPNGAIQTSAT